ncbi:hypothetical protein DBR32_02920 [Taibaiella sp. KBW10]|uniref:alpha-pore-forming cytotoxin subunit MakB n=1 Tax=Taibaiella sp. KBW10 TaxID=2153357 RepID=UPI000F5B4D0E|nr:hypothetical protein [Taibaiella sp. KBW10]RQO32564.1 hypothetical protein DBR32_02920 [Taibaiella sp. KBW10]
MLCPHVNDTSERLALAYSGMINFKGYAYSCNNIRIAILPEDPNWLPAVRNRISLLSDQSGLWMMDEPNVWSQVLLSFITYTNLFEGFTANIGYYTTKEQWIQVLKQLKTGVQQSRNAIEAAAQTYDERYKRFKNIQTLLDESIKAGWEELDDEIKIITEIAGQIQKLQDQLGNLQDDMSGIGLRSGQSYVQSSLSMMYGLVTVAGSSVSFLSMLGLAFTIGKTFYDVYKDNADIANTLHQLNELQLKASYTAQAAAATKMVLQTCYQLEKEFLGLHKSLPYLASIWTAEEDKINEAIDALNSGSDPARMFTLQSMPSALATWTTIAGYCQKMTASPLPGEAVTIQIPTTK